MITVIELLNLLTVEGRISVANRISDEDILDILAKDQNKFVRAATIRNPATRKETINLAVADVEAIVRQAVADNPKTTIDNLKKLKADNEAGVRFVAEKNLNKQN